MNRKALALPPQTAGTEAARAPDAVRERQRASFSRLRIARRLAARLKAMRRRRAVILAVALVPLALLLVPAVWLVHHVYFDRTGVPYLESFIRFEPPTTGVVRDVHGSVLIELAREYRRVVTYDEVPLILRQAILAAEDKRFFDHSGVDYRAVPRVVQKTAGRSFDEWWTRGQALRLLLRIQVDIYLLTNGILVNKKKAEALFNLGVKGVQVSIEGPESIHDSIRGRGSFSGSMNGIKNLLDAGLRVTLNTTLSSVNADHFMDIIGISLRLGVRRIGFSRLVPSGRGKGMLKDVLKTDQVKELYEKIFSLDTGDLEIVTGDPVATQSTIEYIHTDKGKIPLGGCAAGVSGLTVMPDGTITPCRRLPMPIGNIRTDSLREVTGSSSSTNIFGTITARVIPTLTIFSSIAVMPNQG